MLGQNYRQSPSIVARSSWLWAGLVGLVLAPPARAQTMPELNVSLTGRVVTMPQIGSEKLAFVAVEFTPPNGAAATARAVAFSDSDPELETAAGTEVPLDPLERDEPGAASASRRLRDGPTKEAEILKAVPYILTPSFVRMCIDAALAAQGVAAAFGRLDSLASRARTSTVLPDTRLRAGRDRDQSLRLTPTADDPYRYTQSGGVSFVMEAAVTWRLGRFLFASEELSIERLRLAQSRERQRVTHAAMAEMLTWQAAWRRVQAAGTQPSHAAEDLFESTLRLDVMTGGWFSAHQPDSEQFQSAGKGATSAPKPKVQPAGDKSGAPIRVPMPPDQRDLPRKATLPGPEESPPGSVTTGQLERWALSR